MLRIDAHHHLWRYTSDEYEWIDDSMAALRRDFLLDDLRAELRLADVAATVAVQAKQTIEETRWLLELASVGSPIRGVVGWLPLAAENFSALLEEVQTPALKGLRHVIQAEPAGFMDGKEFNRGVDALLDAGLVYDILIVSQQLTEAIRFVDRHPKQAFVLNHIAKPNIRKHEIETWSRDLHELARRPNVSCKLSGMVTEADTANWSSATLGPYFQVVLEAFGPGRLVVGTDWPVITLGCNYARWWEIVESWIAPLSLADQAAILGQNAVRIYGLEGDRT